jgi:hypothetical protein
VVLTSGGDIVVTGGVFSSHLTYRQRDATGQYTTLWSISKRGSGDGQVSYPSGVWIVGDTVWVADTSNSRLVRLSLRDGVWGGVVKLGKEPWDVTVCAGRLYVSAGRHDNARVYVVEDGQVQATHPLTYPPSRDGKRLPWFISHHDGLIAISDNSTHCVYIYNIADMTLVVSLGKDEGLVHPWGVGWDPRDGALVVVDYDTRHVVVYGRDTWRIGERMAVDGAGWLRGICVGEEGQLAVTDWENDHVLIYPAT